MRYPRWLAASFAALCLVGMGATGCGGGSASEAGSGGGSDCGPLSKLETLKLGIIPGSQSLVTFVMQQQGYAKKHNLKLDIKKFQNPSALHAAIGQQAVDVGFGGLTAMATLRKQGRGTLVFDILTSPSNVIFTRKGSPVKDLGDLKGRKLGSFSSRSSTSFAITAILAKQKYGFDLAKGEVIEAPDAALFGLLDQGKIDAALVGTTASVEGLLSDKYTEVADIADEYEAAHGNLPGHVSVASYDGYADEHCGVLKAFSAALDDTVEHIQTSDEVWTNYAKEIHLSDPEAPALMKERVGSRYITDWDQQQADAEKKLITELIPILGPDAFVSEVPEGLFRLDFQSAS